MVTDLTQRQILAQKIEELTQQIKTLQEELDSTPVDVPGVDVKEIAKASVQKKNDFLRRQGLLPNDNMTRAKSYSTIDTNKLQR